MGSSHLNELLEVHIHKVAQINIEEQYSRKNTDYQLSQYIKTDVDMQEKCAEGVQLIKEYIAGEYYPGKMKRVQQLSVLNIDELVLDIFIGIAHCTHHVLFTHVTAQLAGRLDFDDKADAITTIAELLAVLCRTDVFDISKASRQASLTLISRIPLNARLIKLLEDCQYLPPMISKPAVLENNYSSGYYTHNDSLILGSSNHHQGDICLDVLNIMNSTALSLNERFLSSVEEAPTFDLDTQEKVEQWGKFKSQSALFYSLLIQYGNKFYLTHKVDKRGRIYAQGYHINTQGNAYKKASIELAHKEIVTGVPNDSDE